MQAPKNPVSIPQMLIKVVYNLSDSARAPVSLDFMLKSYTLELLINPELSRKPLQITIMWLRC